MSHGLGTRAYREYCWFALVLMAFLICFADRLSSSEESSNQSAAIAATQANVPNR